MGINMEYLEKVKLFINAKAKLGEGPIWDYEKKLLYWIDIIKKEIYIFNPHTGTERIINRFMYYIDTPANEVWGFDYKAETGNISNKRIAVTIPEEL